MYKLNVIRTPKSQNVSSTNVNERNRRSSRGKNVIINMNASIDQWNTQRKREREDGAINRFKFMSSKGMDNKSLSGWTCSNHLNNRHELLFQGPSHSKAKQSSKNL